MQIDSGTIKNILASMCESEKSEGVRLGLTLAILRVVLIEQSSLETSNQAYLRTIKSLQALSAPKETEEKKD